MLLNKLILPNWVCMFCLYALFYYYFFDPVRNNEPIHYCALAS